MVDRNASLPRSDENMLQVRDSKAAYYIRAAALAAGFPNTAGASSIARFCSSGLTATQHVANEIKTGTIEVGVAVGAESLSGGNERLSRPFVDEIMERSDDAKDCMLPMGTKLNNRPFPKIEENRS